ncbi:MAG: hypothetical protein H5T91_00480 [Synergistetes bacterium]|nr:hypothetical protein [Synergistota bacterium]MDK2870852.1 hypothetical protein [bacterium]
MKLLLILCDKAYEPDVIEFLERNGVNMYEMIDGAKFSSPKIKRLSTPVWPGREVIFMGFLSEVTEGQRKAFRELKETIEGKSVAGSLPIRIYIQEVEEV